MEFIGMTAGICADLTTSCILSKLAYACKTGSKVIDKVVMPIGILAISGTVGYAVENHVDKEVEEFKENIEAIKKLNRMKKDLERDIQEEMEKLQRDIEEETKNCTEKVIHNVFEENANEEVNENAD